MRYEELFLLIVSRLVFFDDQRTKNALSALTSEWPYWNFHRVKAANKISFAGETEEKAILPLSHWLNWAHEQKPKRIHISQSVASPPPGMTEMEAAAFAEATAYHVVLSLETAELNYEVQTESARPFKITTQNFVDFINFQKNASALWDWIADSINFMSAYSGQPAIQRDQVELYLLSSAGRQLFEREGPEWVIDFQGIGIRDNIPLEIPGNMQVFFDKREREIADPDFKMPVDPEFPKSYVPPQDTLCLKANDEPYQLLSLRRSQGTYPSPHLAKDRKSVTQDYRNVLQNLAQFAKEAQSGFNEAFRAAEWILQQKDDIFDGAAEDIKKKLDGQWTDAAADEIANQIAYVNQYGPLELTPFEKKLLTSYLYSSVFGGMGSWNDIHFQDKATMEKYHSLSQALFNSRKQILSLLMNP